MSARCVRLASPPGVIGVDKSENKVALTRLGQALIIERDIGDLVARNVQNCRLSATMDAADLTVTDIGEAVDWAETFVATVSDPVYETGLAGARPDQIVLNFARFSFLNVVHRYRKGFLW